MPPGPSSFQLCYFAPAVRPPGERVRGAYRECAGGVREGSLPRMCRGSAPGGGVEEHHAASTHFDETTLLRGPSLMPYS